MAASLAPFETKYESLRAIEQCGNASGQSNEIATAVLQRPIGVVMMSVVAAPLSEYSRWRRASCTESAQIAKTLSCFRFQTRESLRIKGRTNN